MKKLLLLALLPLTLAACGDSRLTPAPGEHPSWPQPGPPRPSHAPLPFTTKYAPLNGQYLETQKPNAEGNVPYAVRGVTPLAEKQPEPATKPEQVQHPGAQ